VALLGCADSGQQKISTTWDTAHGFSLDAHALQEVETLRQSHPGVLWVSGNGISLPLLQSPSTLPAVSTRGEPIAWPDVSMPKQMTAGTELALREIGRDGKLSDAIAHISVDPTSVTEIPYYSWWGAGEAHCYDHCDDPGAPGCDWCKPCNDIGLGCHGIADGPWFAAPYGTCGNRYGSCSDGASGHRCWETDWHEWCG
jgi:hypothetical protein